jgi:hypothetical protein
MARARPRRKHSPVCQTPFRPILRLGSRHGHPEAGAVHALRGERCPFEASASTLSPNKPTVRHATGAELVVVFGQGFPTMHLVNAQVAAGPCGNVQAYILVCPHAPF